MGYLISFSGVNGAGKTTQSKLIFDYLNKKDNTVFYTRDLFDYFFLKIVTKYFKSKKNNKSKNLFIVKKNERFIFKFWFMFAFIDIWVGYIFKIYPKKKKFNYTIADRNYYDIWVTLLYYGYIFEFAFRKTVNLLPKPDIAFLFIVDSKGVAKRERDFKFEYFESQNKIYHKIGDVKGIKIIDANLKINSIFMIIKKEIIKLESKK